MNLIAYPRPFTAICGYAGFAVAALFVSAANAATEEERRPIPTPAQVAAASTAVRSNAEDVDDETLILSPFIVDATRDSGYQATSTLAGTRIRTNLSDVAASIQVVTKEMLQDTGSHNSADLLVYTTSTEVGGVGGNYSATYTTTEGYTVESANFTTTGSRVRGLAAPDLTRDYFPTGIPFDSYNTERVEINRGANSALFGLGSPAGILNNSLVNAQSRTFGAVE